MLLSSFTSGYAFWLLLGLALLMSEFFIPGLVAAFFGLGALAVGVMTLTGIISSPPMQLLSFGGISLLALFGLRRHCARWLRGTVAGRSGSDLDDVGLLGSRVTVLTDFAEGTGTVQLHGAKWDAESDELLRAGHTAWVVRHDGIVLYVSGIEPKQNK